MSVEKEVIAEIKQYINNGDLAGLIGKWTEYQTETDFGREIAWDFIFQKVYLHASLKKQKSICEWLDTIFTELDPIQQIALRQLFSYTRYLLQK